MDCCKNRSAARNRGMSMIYICVSMTIMLAFASLAVDLAKVQVAKTELRRTADAAAMYGCAGMSTSVAQAQANAIASAGENTANGTSVVITSSDIEYGSWNPTARSFTVLTGTSQASATAMRVTCRRTAARGTSIPMTFAQIVGFRNFDVTAQAIATRGTVIAADVQADSCPWLAGMPNGTTVAATGGNPTAASAPNQSPYQVSGLPLVAGQKFSFIQASGQTSYQDAADYGPDSNTGWIVCQDPVNGINSTYAPLNCFVGIFLDNSAPNTTAMNSVLDFSSTSSRNFTTLNPGLKQVFFIGDGINDSGVLQQFTVPTGATRLYLGIMDEKGWWWDNTGSIQTTFLNNKVALVK